MGLAHSPRIVTDNLLLAVDVGNTKSSTSLTAQGQQAYTTPGTYSWTAPVGVTSVCVVCIGAGGAGGAYGGGGGSLAYKNNISVTSGQSYSVEVGASNTAITDNSLVNTNAGLSSAFGTYAFGGRGGNVGGNNSQGIGGNYDGGGEGGNGSGDFYQAGPGYKGGCGGGAGGYSGDGGDAGIGTNNGSDGSGGGGGGGATGSATRSFGGGGVGIYGEGANGSGGVPVYNGGTGIGGGGSGGEDSIVRGTGSTVTGGGLYGGGGGGGNNSVPVTTGSNSGGGAVRIIWGPGRSFPSTNTVDVTSQSEATICKDISGKGNNPTLNGGIKFSSDGGSLNFADDTKNVLFPNVLNQFTSTTAPWTIEMWVKIDNVQNNYCAFFSFSEDDAFGETSTSIGIRNHNPSSGSSDGTYRLTIDRWNGSSVSNDTNPEMTPNRWYHLLATFSETPPAGRNKFSVYLDGSYVASTNTSVSSALSGYQIMLGTNRITGFLLNELGDIGGQISLARFYSSRLSDEQIVDNYNALKSRHSIVHKFLEYTTTSVSSFTLRSTGTVNYEVDWGDGTVQTLTTNTPTHTYSTTGKYTIRITPAAGSTYRPLFANFDSDEAIAVAFGSGGSQLGDNLTDAWTGANNMKSFSADIDTSNVTTFNSAWQFCEGLTSFPLLDVSSGTNFTSAWQNCSGLKSFSALQFNTNASVSLNNAWRNCTGLTSFPVIGSSNVDNFYAAWMFCTALTSFPVIDTSSGTNFAQSWYNCSSLTSFPLLDTSSGTNFSNTWYNCSSLATLAQIDTSSGTNFVSAWYNNAFTSFPALDFSSLTTAANAWENCSSLTTFPANMFDNTGTLTSNAFGAAFNGCALSAQSIENILVSLDANGAQNNMLGLNSGTNAAYSTWSTAATTALSNLQTKNWTVTYNT